MFVTYSPVGTNVYG